MKTKEEIVANWLPRYTKRNLEDFGEYILLTNFNKYVEIFAEKFNVPILGKDANMTSASAEGMTIINFGMGSPNAAIIMDLLSAIKPKACLFLGKIEVMKAYFIAILTLFTCMATVVRAQQMSELENRIDSLLNGKKATVGIAVWTDKGDMLRYNDHVHFPLLSVFKFHVALAVLDKMDKQSISLDSIVSIKASQMLPNTYSPLRKKLPDQDFTITLRELMQYSISQSDNNACDILIEYAGGIKHINDYIRRLGIDSFNLSETEDDMHSSFEAVYRNWSTPSAMARLLRTADEKELFSNKELKDFLWQTMIDTETGANKLKGMLPAKTVVGHKTGSSDRNADSMKTADNDAGLVILPDGRKYYIATFIMDSYETDEDNADIIARISRMVYDAMR